MSSNLAIKKERKGTDYAYYGYTVTENGEFYSPLGNKIAWNKDGRHIKLNLDGKVKEFNGLKILYCLFHELNAKPSSKYKVELIDPNGCRNKSNLQLIERTYSSKAVFSHEEIEKIKEEYGTHLLGRNNEKRKEIKNQDNHPTMSYRQLANKYNVSLSTIEAIIQGTYGKRQVGKKS